MDELQELQTLREELRRHSLAYYDQDAPTISDFEYDALMRRLRELEAAHPRGRYPGLAPAKRWGAIGRRNLHRWHMPYRWNP